MFKLKYNYVTNTSDEPYIQYWFAKKLEAIAGSTVTGEGADFNIVSPTERSIKEVVLKGDTTQETLSGKNLMPASDYNAADNRVMFIPTLEFGTGTFTLSFNLDSFELGTNSNFVVQMEVYDSEATKHTFNILNVGESTTTGNKTYTVTTTYNVVKAANTDIKIAQSSYDNGARVVLSNIQLEAGSATTYEPYCGGIPSPNPDYPQTVNTVTGDQTITITKGSDVQTYSLTLGDLELCKIGDYQDYIYKDGEKWYVKNNTNKVILDGSEDESWGVQNTGTASFFYRYRQLADVGEVELQFYCNRATPTAISSNNTSEGAYIVTSSAATYHDFRVRYGTEMTVANWRTFLSTHNFILYYILATPTDTEITDETLLGQLNTILSDGYLSAGTNTVQTSATGLPIIINIKA